MWRKGPEFLQLSDHQWPSTEAFPPSEITEAEVAKNLRGFTHVLLSASGIEGSRIDEIIDCTRYSRLNVLLRVTGFVLKFRDLLLRDSHSEPMRLHPSGGYLTGEELNVAEVH